MEEAGRQQWLLSTELPGAGMPVMAGTGREGPGGARHVSESSQRPWEGGSLPPICRRGQSLRGCTAGQGSRRDSGPGPFSPSGCCSAVGTGLLLCPPRSCHTRVCPPPLLTPGCSRPHLEDRLWAPLL